MCFARQPAVPSGRFDDVSSVLGNVALLSGASWWFVTEPRGGSSSNETVARGDYVRRRRGGLLKVAWVALGGDGSNVGAHGGVSSIWVISDLFGRMCLFLVL